MKILTISGSKLDILDKTIFTQERILQDYLEQYPEIIPLGDIVENPPQLICIGREVTTPSGSIDLLYIDLDGRITIVETKLVKNPEIRREVIGQIVEYASYVTQWTSEDIANIAESFLNQSLPETIKAKNPQVDIEAFNHKVNDYLKNGILRLLVVSDELNEPLRSTITFLNSNSNFDFLLLQVSSYSDGLEKKVVVPTLFGYAKKVSRNPSGNKMNEEKFITRCNEAGHANSVKILLKSKELINDSSLRGDFVNWGVSGYSYRMPWKEYPAGETIFVGYDGTLQFWRDHTIRTKEPGESFIQKLANMPIFAREFARQKAPTIPTDKMSDSDITQFIELVRDLGTNLGK